MSPDSYRNHVPTKIVIRGTGFSPDSEVMLHRGKSEKARIQDTPGKSYGVAISGSYAYVADFNKGLQVIEIKDPVNPRKIGHFNTNGYTSDLDISGSYAYVADGPKGLKIIDISNPEQPGEAGIYNTEGNALSVSVSGRYAYVADGGIGMKIIDITHPATPPAWREITLAPELHMI